MNYLTMLKELQGNLSQEAFAEKLGITQPTLSRFYGQQSYPSRDVIAALVRTFPERRDEILSVFFAPEHMQGLTRQSDPA